MPHSSALLSLIMAEKPAKTAASKRKTAIDYIRKLVDFPRVKIIKETPEAYLVKFGAENIEVRKSDETYFESESGSSGPASHGMALCQEIRQLLLPVNGIFQDEEAERKFAEVMIFHELREKEYDETALEDDPDVSAHQKAVHDEILYVLKHLPPADQEEYFRFADKYRKRAVKRTDKDETPIAPPEVLSLKDRHIRNVWQYGNYLATIPEDFEYYREVVLAGVKLRGEALRFASEKMRDDEEVVLAAVTSNFGAMRYASERLKGDPEFALKILRITSQLFPYISGKLTEDRDFFLKVIEINPLFLLDAKENIKKDKGIVLRAVTLMSYLAGQIDRELLRDRGFILEIVSAKPLALEFLPFEMRINEEVVLAAIKKNAEAIQYVEAALRVNFDFLAKAVQVNPELLNSVYLSADFKKWWEEVSAYYTKFEL